MVSCETADAILSSQAWGKRAWMAQLYGPAERIISIFPGADTWDLALLNARQSHSAHNTETSLQAHVQNWLGSQFAAYLPSALWDTG